MKLLPRLPILIQSKLVQLSRVSVFIHNHVVDNSQLRS